MLFGLVNTALHYFFFYLGVSNSPGGRASILDSLGTFLLILAAAVVFREKLTLRSIFGCLLGFSGIVLINLGSTDGQFTLSGDGMLLCSSVCAMAGGLLTRVVTRKMDPLVATGHSLALGGALLIPAGLLMGAHPVGVHLKGLLILAALVAVSAVGFSFYNQLLRYHPVGQIAIYNAFIPVLGVVLSCLLLGEPFSWRYLLSGALVTVGICAVNCRQRQELTANAKYGMLWVQSSAHFLRKEEVPNGPVQSAKPELSGQLSTTLSAALSTGASGL